MEVTAPDVLSGTPELTPIGKRIEMLRIERGLSKQQLAKTAGISRQQLWRVLAGKSELTSSLCERLAFVLQTDISVLADFDGAHAPRGTLARWFASSGSDVGPLAPQHASTVVAAAAPATFAQFVAGADLLRGTLAALPLCDDGAALKRAVLDAIEDIAIARGVALAPAFFELRRAVIAREL